ncbi:MAG TPA: TetR/AcrR family transcriptional regulator [Propionibacteriaceae bacterium]|nr:TetR/AcrR family transcriptional regulator [Propionibacteriaceae bacterium]
MKYGVVKMESETAKRPYRQRLRAESSALTRQRIIEAARQVLTTQPFHGFNISEVADLARVVRSTIYTVFGSREGLLRAVAQDMSERGGWERMREAFRDPDAWQAVRRNLEEGTRMIASEHSVALAITVLAAVDPDAAVVAAEMDEVRLRGVRSLARRLGEQGYLRPELSQEEAVDILWVLTSWNTFNQLYSGRELDQPSVADRLVTMARLTLCRPQTTTVSTMEPAPAMKTGMAR